MADLSITIENVRRIQTATISFGKRSRVVIVGRNNSGKTTTLDMISRALWSLPGGGDNGWLEFHASWYRREGAALLRPKITIALPTEYLPERVCADRDGTILFTQVGRHLPFRLTRQSAVNSRLVTTDAELTTKNGESASLIRTHNPTAEDIWGDSALTIATAMHEQEKSGKPLDVTAANASTSSFSASALSASSMPFTRALGELARRVIYVPASRAPQLAPGRTLGDFSQANLLHVTPLLLRLKATKPEDFAAISSGLSLLFPDVRELRLSEHGEDVVPEIQFEDGRSEYVGNVGYGFQNAIHLLTVLMSLPRDAILLVDEPETGLNQACQRDLATILETARPDIALVVATQSEAFCRGFSGASSILLAEAERDTSTITRVHIFDDPLHMRRLAKAMGSDPLFLDEGGKIVYVEGASDEVVIGRWLDLHFPGLRQRYQVVPLGGCGRVGEAFVKPLIVAHRERVFVLLDSDRTASDAPPSPDIERLRYWLAKECVPHYVLERRELENYLGADRIAEAAGVHPAQLRGAAGHENWFDIKAAFTAHHHHYDERRIALAAYEAMTRDQKLNLFGDETTTLVRKFASFLAAEKS